MQRYLDMHVAKTVQIYPAKRVATRGVDTDLLNQVCFRGRGGGNRSSPLHNQQRRWSVRGTLCNPELDFLSVAHGTGTCRTTPPRSL